MSEPTAPYSTFSPTVPRFRVWDGERMHLPGANGYNADPFVITMDGDVAEENDNRGLDYPDGIPLLSTGLRDADGREVFEGDLVSADGGTYPVCYERGGFVAKGYWHSMQDNPGDLFAEGEHFRVVGNVYEGIREPA